jgi:hypothetical protein
MSRLVKSLEEGKDRFYRVEDESRRARSASVESRYVGVVGFRCAATCCDAMLCLPRQLAAPRGRGERPSRESNLASFASCRHLLIRW